MNADAHGLGIAPNLCASAYIGGFYTSASRLLAPVRLYRTRAAAHGMIDAGRIIACVAWSVYPNYSQAALMMKQRPEYKLELIK